MVDHFESRRGEEVAGNRRTRTGWLLAVTGGAFVLSLTLWPTSGAAGQEMSFWCILCGSRALADTLLNILLFAPFGAGIGLLRGVWWALAASAALSGSIEFAQTFLPGRFSVFDDILANSTGGLVGALLATKTSRIRRLVLAPPRSRQVGSALAPAAVLLATAVLSSPHLTDGIYYGQWTRDLGRLRAYPGTVLEASVGSVPLPDVRIPQQEAMEEALRTGERLEITFIAGPPPRELSHLLAIFDDRQQGVLMLMVQRDDLIFQRRTLSVPLLLDQPFIRWRGGLTVPEGDTVRVAVWQEPRNLCMQIDARIRCDLSAGVEGGWRLLHRLFSAPSRLEGLLEVVWLILLSLPMGPTARGTGRAVLLGAGLALLGVLLSWYSPWLSVGSVAPGVPVVGAWMGFQLRTGLAGMRPYQMRV
jgi:hypothetical protein